MKIQANITKFSPCFNGHEAKKLDAILVHNNNEFGSDSLFRQLDAIASKHKVSVEKIKYFPDTWIQDKIYFTPNKKIISSNYNYAYAYSQFYGLEPDSLTCKDNPYRYFHVDGGNTLFVTDKDKKQVVLTAREINGECRLEGQEETLGVDKIISLPRADYHADLFITPIGDNKILVASDELMLDGLNKILNTCNSFVFDNPNDESVEEIIKLSEKLSALIDEFSKNIKEYNFKGCDDETAQILQDNGFEVIRVPSRIYNFEMWKDANNRNLVTHVLNYSNAITFKDRNNETVLISAKSGIEKKIGLTSEIAKKIGIDFEKLFIESVSPYIDPKNIHFILGDRNRPIADILEECKGGLHCMCVEVPYYDDLDFKI